jgi:6,7-dimethyl-8-ribityllumazine synthase
MILFRNKTSKERRQKMEQNNQTKIAIVVADFNKEITSVMKSVAKKRAQEMNAIITKTIHVPGVYDAPLAVKKLLKKENVQGVIVLGVVLSGGSAHDAHVADNNARLCADLSVQYEKPVALSVIGHKVSKQQALERKESYAQHGIDALIALIKEYKQLEQ